MEAFLILTTGFLKQRRLMDKIAGLALVVSYDLFPRSSETWGMSSRDFIAPQARDCWSVSVTIAQSDISNDNTREKRTIHGQLARPPARIRAGAADTSESCLPNRRTVAFAADAHRTRTSSRKCGQTNATHDVEDLSALSLLRRRRAAFKLLLDLAGTQKRGQWLAANSVRRYEKLADPTRQVALPDHSSVNNSGQALVDFSFMKLCWAAVVDIPAPSHSSASAL